MVGKVRRQHTEEDVETLGTRKRRYGYVLAWLLSLLSAITMGLVFGLSPVALAALLGVPAFAFLASVPVAGIAAILAVSTLIVSAAIFTLLVHTYRHIRGEHRAGHFFARYPMLSAGIAAFALASLLVAFIPGAFVAISSVPAFAFLGMMGAASPFVAPLIVGAAAALVVGFLTKIAVNSYQDRRAKFYDEYQSNRFLQALANHSRIATLGIGAAVVGLALGLTAGFVPAVVPGFIVAFGFGAPLTALVFGLMVAATVIVALGIPTMILSMSHRQRVTEPSLYRAYRGGIEVAIKHEQQMITMISALMAHVQAHPLAEDTPEGRKEAFKSVYNRIYPEQGNAASYRPFFSQDTDIPTIMGAVFRSPPAAPGGGQ